MFVPSVGIAVAVGFRIPELPDSEAIRINGKQLADIFQAPRYPRTCTPHCVLYPIPRTRWLHIVPWPYPYVRQACTTYRSKALDGTVLRRTGTPASMH